MNNNFVVKIPTNLKKIKSKLFMGFTKRQGIGLLLILAFGLPVFFFLKQFGVEPALWGLLTVASPIIFGVMYSKDNLKSETWIKLFINFKKVYPKYKKIHFNKAKVDIAYQRGFIKK
ncbi:TPA: PrgI family protein [Streptococcus suis]|nr:PrgI family protein [Streptococcus suis]HEM4142638.1 PrgI family protein [Streptococcus suis]HEP1788664.1 PrgI family protein [Streptococcus suis]